MVHLTAALVLWYPIRYHAWMIAKDVLRTARQRSGLTLRQLASTAGTSHSTLSAYESGSKTPSTATLNRIVHAAGYALDASLRPRVRAAGGLSRGDELEAVLELAEAFPARHDARLNAPVFGATS